MNDGKLDIACKYSVWLYLGNYFKNRKFNEFIGRFDKNDNTTMKINRINVLRSDVNNL